MPWSKNEPLKSAVRFTLLLSLTLTTSIILAPTPVPSSPSLQSGEQQAAVAHQPQERASDDADASLPISEHPVESSALTEAERSPVSASAYESSRWTTASTSADDPVADAAKRAKLKSALGQLPLSFIENQGQLDDRVAYYAQDGGADFYFTAEEVVMALPETVLRTRFVGANPNVRITGADKQEAKFSYFIGDDTDGWYRGLRSYGKVAYRDLYPGIDLAYTESDGELKYEFVLDPGADLNAIRLAYAGAEVLHLAENGDLLVTPEGSAQDVSVRDAAPTVYQDIDGQRVTVKGTFRLYGEKTYGFEVGEYDPSYPLVIDPQLSYSTFLGGSSSEFGSGIVTDDEGAVYLTGESYSTDFPTTSGAYDMNNRGSRDVFVTVLDPTLSTLRYSTFLGGEDADEGCAIALDGSGNVYVRGGTLSTDFPTTPGAYDMNYNGVKDVILSVLDPTLSNLLHSTYLGGSDLEWDGGSMALDSSGNVYVTGVTDSADFPITSGAYDPNHSGSKDIFVSVLDPTLSELRYSTFLGGSGEEWTHFGISLDDTGNVYLTGNTGSTDFPTTDGAYNTNYDGGAFVSVLDPTLSTLRYSTFLGASCNSRTVALDSAGNVYVVGRTWSGDFPTTDGAYDTSYNGGDDIFVSVLDPTLSTLRYSTFLGGSAGDYIYRGLALDSAGNVYVVGQTGSGDFPTTDGAYDTSYNGGDDIFVSVLDPTLSILSYSTFLGGDSHERPWAAVDGGGCVYVTGGTYSTDFPTSDGAYDTGHNGSQDAFVAVVDASGPTTYSISGRVKDSGGDPISGVTISAGEGASTTDASGAYSVADLIASTYTLTPTKSGWTFSPPTRTVSVPPDATGQNFTGEALDLTPPATITDLTASTGSRPGEVDLSWTAPGDDGNTGTATTYTVRYADSTIGSGLAWAAATSVEGEPAPQPAGSHESMTVSGLTPGQTYYFAVRTQDEASNWSDLSNSPFAVAEQGPGDTYYISGHVLDGNSDAVPDLIVSAGAGYSTTTDARGAYTITGVLTGTYILTPTKAGWTFSPPTRTVSVPPDATEQDFVGTPPALSLLVVPLRWQRTQTAFDTEAQTQTSLFLDDVPLSSCRERVLVEILDVGTQNYTDFACSSSDCAVNSVRKFVRDDLDIDPSQYDVVVGLAEASPCAPIAGCSNGTDTIWVTSQYDIVTAHELGHIFDLEDQYCSNQAGSTDSRCNDGDSQDDGAASGDVNWLDTDLPCDCPPDGADDSSNSPCCNFGGRDCSTVNYGVCCLGNKNAAGGRSTMSFADAPGPRGFDSHDLTYLNTLPELRCEAASLGGQSYVSHLVESDPQTIVEVELLVHPDDSVTAGNISIGYGFPTSASILDGLNGDYELQTVDAVGDRIWSQSFGLYFDYQGPMVLDVDYSSIAYSKRDVSFRIPHSTRMSAVELYHGDDLIFSQALPSVHLVYLPLVLRR